MRRKNKGPKHEFPFPQTHPGNRWAAGLPLELQNKAAQVP